MQKTKEVPESIYLLASMQRQPVEVECGGCKNKMAGIVEVPVTGIFCKAFTLDEAFGKMSVKHPGLNIRNLGSLSVTDFLTGCELQVTEAPKTENLVSLQEQKEEVVDVPALTREQQLESMAAMLNENGYTVFKKDNE